FETIREELERRLDTLETTAPIAFRPQNGGAYDIPQLTLRDDVAPGLSGFAAHREA
ncbi:MAG TPA: flavodoxin family protein, partial [Duganella sp.]